MKRQIGFLITLFAMISATLWLQASFVDKRYPKTAPNPDCPWCEDKRLEQDVIFVPLKAPVMRLFSPADPLFLADLLWLRTIYYFGQHALTNRQYPYLLHLLDLITDLDPDWLAPYLFGAVLLPIEAEAVEDGFYMIDKGLSRFPENWELWFFKGYYLWQYRGDVLGAAKALNTASRQPKAPGYLVRLSASLATTAGQKELALVFLEEALQNVTDPKQRKLLIEKIRTIQDPEQRKDLIRKIRPKETPVGN